MASYILYFIQILVIVRKKYNFSFNAGFKKVLLVNLFFTVVAIFVVKLITNPYWIGLVILILSICYSLRELDRRIEASWKTEPAVDNESKDSPTLTKEEKRDHFRKLKEKHKI